MFSSHIKFYICTLSFADLIHLTIPNEQMEKEAKGENQMKKICCACSESLGICSFSKKQWMNKIQRRCKECIASDNPVKMQQQSSAIRQSSKHSKKRDSIRRIEYATRKLGGCNTQSPDTTTSGHFPIPAGDNSSATRHSAPYPQPTLEQLAEIKERMMSDPSCLMQFANNPELMKSMYQSDPKYANFVANNPFMEQTISMAKNGELDMSALTDLLKNMSVEQVQEMMSAHLNVTEEEKVSLKPAKGLSNETSCWVCLDGGNDEEGNPLVRDCSCRGNSG